MSEFWIWFVVVVAVAVIALLASYNGLVQLRQQVRAAWGEMDDQLKRRYDLVPSLTNFGQLAGLDPQALSEIIAAKNKAGVAFNPSDLASAESSLSAAIHHVLEAGSGKPEIQADTRFGEINRQLKLCESQIGQTRLHYNNEVSAFNAALVSFPYSVTAGLLGFKPQPMF